MCNGAPFHKIPVSDFICGIYMSRDVRYIQIKDTIYMYSFGTYYLIELLVD